MKEKFNAGVIGLGNIGFRYTLDPLRNWISSHVEAYNSHPGFELVACCDIDPDRLKDLKDCCPQVRLYTSWENMLAAENLDVLSVCVSPELNYEVSCSDNFSKLKAVIFEKPFSKDTAAGLKIVDNVRGAGVIAAVNHFRRWQGTFLKLKDLIDSDAIGDIRKIIGRYATTLFNGGIHLIDTIQYLAGNFTEIRALDRIKVSNPADFAYSAYGKVDNTEVFITGFDKSCYNIFEIEIWADKGKLFVDNFGTRIRLSEALPSERFSLQKELTEVKEFDSGDLGSNFPNLLDNLFSALSGRKESRILCRPEDSLQTIKVAEQIVHSYNSGGSLIKLAGREILS
jgi:predicted dehydrogenase